MFFRIIIFLFDPPAFKKQYAGRFRHGRRSAIPSVPISFWVWLVSFMILKRDSETGLSGSFPFFRPGILGGPHSLGYVSLWFEFGR